MQEKVVCPMCKHLGFKSFVYEIDWKSHFQKFGRLFLEEIENSNITEICREIVQENMKRKDITFLCYEKDELICHRKFIKKICEQELSKVNSLLC